MSLYISRIVSSLEIYIMDSEDGVEECVSVSDLKGIVGLGVVIGGVDTHQEDGEVKIDAVYCERVQNLRNKYRMIYGIDIDVVYGTLAGIYKTSEVGAKSVPRIKLSDFCADCDKKVLNDDLPELVIVLDDNVKFGPKTFYQIDKTKVKLDTSGIKNWQTLKMVYDTLIKSDCSDCDALMSCVIDTVERQRLLRAVLAISFFPASVENSTQLFGDDAICHELHQLFCQDFNMLCCKKFEPYSGHVDQLVTYAKEEFSGVDRFKSEGFSICKQVWYNLFLVLGYHTQYDVLTLRRFGNYVKYFNVSQQVRDQFVRFYNGVRRHLYVKYKG